MKRVAWPVLLVALIIVPFVLYGGQLDRWTERVVASGDAHPWIAAWVFGGLLGGDILLPVPSSMVSTACGMLYGVLGGALISLAGMTVSCVAGFWLARVLGRRFVQRFAGEAEIARVESLNARYGAWAIILARPIPVLAEASVLVVGLGAVSFFRFFVLTLLSNLGISLVYGVAGGLSAGANSFLPALAASIGFPWLMMALHKRKQAPASATRDAIAEGDCS